MFLKTSENLVSEILDYFKDYPICISMASSGLSTFLRDEISFDLDNCTVLRVKPASLEFDDIIANNSFVKITTRYNNVPIVVCMSTMQPTFTILSPDTPEGRSVLLVLKLKFG